VQSRIVQNLTVSLLVGSILQLRVVGCICRYRFITASKSAGAASRIMRQGVLPMEASASIATRTITRER